MWDEYRFVDKTGKIIGEVRPNWRGYVSAFLHKPDGRIHLGDWISFSGACLAVKNACQNDLRENH